MRNILSGLALFSVLSLCSCQKELDDDPGGNPPPSGNNDTVFWKFAELDTTLPAGLDTLEIYLYEYDNEKRISRITDYMRDDTSPAPAFSFVRITDFSYSGNERVPFKVASAATDIGYEFYDTSYYTYQNGLISRDSTIHIAINTIAGFTTKVITISTYVKSGNNILSNQKQYNYIGTTPLLCESNSTYIMTYSGGNITGENISITGCVTGLSDVQMNHDNKINPFFNTTVPYPVAEPNINRNVQKNNLISETSASHGFDNRYAYTYRQDGYPLVVRVTGLLDPSYHAKGLYFYR